MTIQTPAGRFGCDMLSTRVNEEGQGMGVRRFWRAAAGTAVIAMFLPLVAMGMVNTPETLEQATQGTTYSGINRVTLTRGKETKPFIGNGFLIEWQGRVFATTVKHALLELGASGPPVINVSDYVERWQIHPNGSVDRAVTLGRLLNQDDGESLDMSILARDWLVFEVASNTSELAPLSIRDTDADPIIPGETLIAVGCTYGGSIDCRQDVFRGHYLANTETNLRVELEEHDPLSLRGLSGSPVIDEQGRLVGIVSNVLPSRDGNGLDFAPANLNYLLQVLARLNLDG